MNPKNSMDEKFIERLTKVIEDNLQDEKFGASELAEQLGMSRVTLYRKVKSVIKKSVSEFIRETRLIRACEMLQNKEGTVAEISYKVGFSSPPYFNKCFHDYYGFTPGDVLKGICEIKRDSGITEKETVRKSVVPLSYLLIFATLIISIGVFAVFTLLKPFSASEETIQILVIPPFKVENPGSAKSNANLIRLELHNRLNLSKLIVKDQSMTNDSAFLIMEPQKLAESLKADYVLKCDRTDTDEGPRYFFRLLDRHANIIWTQSFFENEKSANEFAGNVANFIVSELKIELTPVEKEKLQKLPSENVFALKMYEDGIKLTELTNANLDDMKRAIISFQAAIEHDSTFADAYARLSYLYSSLLPEEKQDVPKAKHYILKALKYEKKMAWYYGLLAICYEKEGNKNAADSCNRISNQFPRNDKYYYASSVYGNDMKGQHYEAIKYAFMFYKLNEGSGDPDGNILYWTWQNLSLMGFPEVAKKYLIKMMKSWGTDSTDTTTYWKMLNQTYGSSGKPEIAKEYALKLFKNDTSNLGLLDDLTTYEILLGNIEKSRYYIKLNDSIRNAKHFDLYFGHGDLSFGVAYMEAGEKEKAMYVFNAEIKLCLEEIEQNTEFAKRFGPQMNLAAIYAYLGDRDKTFKYLTAVKDSKTFFGYHLLVLNFPVFERISKDDREIRKVINDIKKQYNSEHQKIENLLAEEGLIT